MSHTQVIYLLKDRGIPVSPFMHYWLIEELVRYACKHLGYMPETE